MGNAICGNSAIAAAAPVIRAERKDVASAIGLTAVVGVVIVVLLPAAVRSVGLRVGLASALLMGFLVGVSLLLICALGLHGGDR